MRILVASLLFAAACGGSKPKTDNAIVQTGSDVPDTCCCKTTPETDEKEITPVYAMAGRMECSTKQGTCVDDVQCNGSQQAQQPGQTPPATPDTGVPPPPDLGNGNAGSGSD